MIFFFFHGNLRAPIVLLNCYDQIGVLLQWYNSIPFMVARSDVWHCALLRG